MEEERERIPYPGSRWIVLNARTMLLCWFLLVLMSLWTVLIFAGLPIDIGETGMWAFLCLFLSVGALTVVFALAHKCPHCSKHPTLQGNWEKPHPDSLSQSSWFKSWPGVIVSVIRNKRFTCIHCGAKYSVTGKK